MLKLYVDSMIRLHSSTEALSQSLTEKRDASESGFVSAETIALAVAGILIVGGLLLVFKAKLGLAVDKLFTNIDGWT